MPAAVSTFLDTPINGHNPKNWLSTTLLTKAAPTAIKIKFISYASFSVFGSAWQSPFFLSDFSAVLPYDSDVQAVADTVFVSFVSALLCEDTFYGSFHIF
jgi:hypothetical protein